MGDGRDEQDEQERFACIGIAFEEQRYWDARRWKTAETAFNKTLPGRQIIKNSDGSYSYEVEPVQPILFSTPKMYL